MTARGPSERTSAAVRIDRVTHLAEGYHRVLEGRLRPRGGEQCGS